MTRSDQPSGGASRAESVSLTERQRLLQLVRAALVVLVVGAALAVPNLVGAATGSLLAVAAGYAGWCAAGELLWRGAGRRALPLVGVMLLADGVFLAAVQQLTTDPAGVVRLLLVPHIIAVTLLASYRTGLKVALWHSLLLYAAHHAQAVELLPAPSAAVPAYGELAAFVALLWLVTLTTAVFSAVNERELRRRKIDLQTLAAMADELEHESSPTAVAEVLLGSVVEAFDYRRGAVVGLRGGQPLLLATSGAATDEVVPRAAGVLGRVWDEGHPVLLRALDAAADADLVALFPAASYVVVVPLAADGVQIGALVVELGRRQAGGMERRVLAMTEQMAAHAALALRNAWLLDQVRELADTDGLTGLSNRRAFDAMLAREIDRSQRTGQSVSLLLLDIDHFKLLNDTHGHQMGDEVLRELGALLKRRTRQMDMPARYGGEEFVVILSGCDEDVAFDIAERFRQAIAEAPTPVPITVSIGVGTCPVDATDAPGLIKAADSALYASKEAGRNRVTVYGCEPLLDVS